jgi:hypothetical protein
MSNLSEDGSPIDPQSELEVDINFRGLPQYPAEGWAMVQTAAANEGTAHLSVLMDRVGGLHDMKVVLQDRMEAVRRLLQENRAFAAWDQLQAEVDMLSTASLNTMLRISRVRLPATADESTSVQHARNIRELNSQTDVFLSLQSHIEAMKKKAIAAGRIATGTARASARLAMTTPLTLRSKSLGKRTDKYSCVQTISGRTTFTRGYVTSISSVTRLTVLRRRFNS